MNSICPICSEATNESKVCNACKTFYSRNRSVVAFPCIQNTYECELTPENRSKCRGCRLKKCQENITPETSPVLNLKRTTTGEREDEENKRAREMIIAERPETPAAADRGGHRIGGNPRVLDDIPRQRRTPSTSPNSTPQRPDSIEDALDVLGQILPAEGSYVETVTSIADRPDALTYAMNIAENHMMKWGDPFFKTHPGYKYHPLPQWLMARGVFLCSVLDMTWAILNRTVGYEYALNDEADRVTPMELAVFGNEEILPSYNQILELLRTNGLPRLDYCLYRALAVYDPKWMTDEVTYRNWNLRVLNAYQMAKMPSKPQMDDVMSIFSMFQALAQFNMNYCETKKDPMCRETYRLIWLGTTLEKMAARERRGANRRGRFISARRQNFN